MKVLDNQQQKLGEKSTKTTLYFVIMVGLKVFKKEYLF